MSNIFLKAKAKTWGAKAKAYYPMPDLHEESSKILKASRPRPGLQNNKNEIKNQGARSHRVRCALKGTSLASSSLASLLYLSSAEYRAVPLQVIQQVPVRPYVTQLLHIGFNWLWGQWVRPFRRHTPNVTNLNPNPNLACDV